MVGKKFSVKSYLKAAGITVFFAAFILLLPTERSAVSQSSGYSITYASVQNDILKTAQLQIKELHGVMVTDYDHQKVEYYFEYEANAADTLRMVGALPFSIDDHRSSLQCMLMESNANPLEMKAAFPQEIREGVSFFFDSVAEDFIFYECVKSTMKHTLLISKTSSRILHKVESI